MRVMNDMCESHSDERQVRESQRVINVRGSGMTCVRVMNDKCESHGDERHVRESQTRVMNVRGA